MNKKDIGKNMAVFMITAMMLTVLGGCIGGEEEPSTTTPAPTTAAPTAPPGYLTYESSTYGIRIKYPGEWEKMEDYMDTVVLFRSPPENGSDMFQENINVVIGDLPQSTTLDEFFDLNIEQIKTLFVIENVDSSSTTLANTPAKKVTYTLKQGEYALKTMQIYTIKDDKAYVISYMAEEDKYSDFLGTIQIIIDSFEII